jgi:hypothetical protein
MRTKLLMAVVVVVGLPLMTACKQKEQGAEPPSESHEAAAPSATPGEIPGTNNGNPNDISAMKAQSWVDDVTLGRKVQPDGTVADADKTDDFKAGDSIYLTMKVSDAPAGSQVKTIWYGPADQKIDEESKDVKVGDKTLTFERTKTASWKDGDYRVEVWTGDEKVKTAEFSLGEKKKPVQ